MTQTHSVLQMYLAVAGTIGAVCCAIQAQDTLLPTSVSTRILAGFGLLIFLCYIACAVVFKRAIRQRWVVRVIGTLLVWGLLVLVSLFMATGDARQLVIPWLLFVMVPGLSALWKAQDLCAAHE